jgi:transcriptional regulator with XRE-family HTH domain
MTTQEEAPLVKTLSAYLQRTRLQQGWSRAELAKRAQINVYTLKHFERTGQISLARFLALCQTLGLADNFLTAIKPRQRLNVNDWSIPIMDQRKRGRRTTNAVAAPLETE